MIKIKEVTPKSVELSWDTGADYQYMELIKKLIENRNNLININKVIK